MELRTYTLADADALERYVHTFWQPHIRTLHKFGITVHGVWTDPSHGRRVLALISYRAGEDPQFLSENYRLSADFVDDHADFDAGLITATETLMLYPIAGSPLQ